jgi:alanyl-tRNA synthetase
MKSDDSQLNDVRNDFLETFAEAGFRRSPALSLLQPTIKTSFLFSVGFVEVLDAIAGKSPDLDGAATVQRCFRHFDVDRVSDDRHLSLFEMAGALRCSDWNIADLVTPLVGFLVQHCALPRERLHVTYFGGGDVAGEVLAPDYTARDAYLNAGVAAANVWAGDHSTNIWFEGANSGTPRSGICGPHSEMFFDLAPDSAAANGGGPLTQADRYLEVSNIVAITHRTRPGTDSGLSALPKPLVELALGVERLEMLMTGAQSVYQTPKFLSITDAVLSACAADRRAESFDRALRVTVDHLRALTHLIADGGRPGPKGRRNVVRRLLKGLLQAAAVLELDACAAFPKLAWIVADVDEAINPNLSNEMTAIIDTFDREARRMSRIKSGPLQ